MYAFYDCGELNNLIIPDSINSVRFAHNTGVELLDMPNNWAFSGCGKLPLATRSKIESLGYEGEF
jgi:hypothetical protein